MFLKGLGKFSLSLRFSQWNQHTPVSPPRPPFSGVLFGSIISNMLLLSIWSKESHQACLETPVDSIFTQRARSLSPPGSPFIRRGCGLLFPLQMWGVRRAEAEGDVARSSSLWLTPRGRDQNASCPFWSFWRSVDCACWFFFSTKMFYSDWHFGTFWISVGLIPRTIWHISKVGIILLPVLSSLSIQFYRCRKGSWNINFAM